MKIKRSYLTAGIALLLIVIWFAVNSGRTAEVPPAQNQPPALAEKNKDPDGLMQVVVRQIAPKLHPFRLELFGQSEPAREVSVKAETPGVVTRAPAKEGQLVAKGALLCQQDVDARSSNLDQANAMLETRKLEEEAARKLVAHGYTSETQLKAASAALDNAKAGVKSAQIELDNVNMRAPFKGIFDTRLAEIGDYLSPGQPCGIVLELDPLKIAVELTEDQLSAAKLDQKAEVKLATGESLTGKITYIEARANPSTRTFKTEISLPNPDMALRAGITATAWLTAGEQMAYFVPAQTLTLSDDGAVGIRYLDGRNIVRFQAVQTIDEAAGGIWVTGFDGPVSLIIKGQDYVAIGTEARPVSETDTNTAP